MSRWTLAVDLGTTFTTAAVARDGRVDLVEIDGATRMSSAVAMSPEGTVVVGRAARRFAASDPGRVEHTPKKAVGSGGVIVLGGQPLALSEALAAVLTVPFQEACRLRGGTRPTRVVLTYPAVWGAERQRVLREAAERAAFGGDVGLIEEPVAAATHFAGQLQPGALVSVYDLGGGTFDAAVLRRTESGFELVGKPGGLEGHAGEDFDHVIAEHLGSALRDLRPEAWEAMQTSDERVWLQALADLREQARHAKEELSAYPSASVYLGGSVDCELHLTRAELEGLLAPLVEPTVDQLMSTIADANIEVDELAGIYLAGGSSRIPLVAQLIHQRLGRTADTLDEPKTVVALGAAKAATVLGAVKQPSRPQPHPVSPRQSRPAPPQPPPPPAPEPQPEPAPAALGPPRPQKAPTPPFLLRPGTLAAVGAAIPAFWFPAYLAFGGPVTVDAVVIAFFSVLSALPLAALVARVAGLFTVSTVVSAAAAVAALYASLIVPSLFLVVAASANTGVAYHSFRDRKTVSTEPRLRAPRRVHPQDTLRPQGPPAWLLATVGAAMPVLVHLVDRLEVARLGLWWISYGSLRVAMVVILAVLPFAALLARRSALFTLSSVIAVAAAVAATGLALLGFAGLLVWHGFGPWPILRSLALVYPVVSFGWTRYVFPNLLLVAALANMGLAYQSFRSRGVGSATDRHGL